MVLEKEKKISRRSFLAASAALGAAGVLTACGGGSSSTAASTATSAAGSTAASGDASADPAVTLVYAEEPPDTMDSRGRCCHSLAMGRILSVIRLMVLSDTEIP